MRGARVGLGGHEHSGAGENRRVPRVGESAVFRPAFLRVNGDRPLKRCPGAGALTTRTIGGETSSADVGREAPVLSSPVSLGRDRGNALYPSYSARNCCVDGLRRIGRSVPRPST